MTALRTIEVPEDAAGARLDRFLAARLPDHSRTRIQEWIRDGLVRVGGAAARASRVLESGETVEFDPPQATPSTLQAEAFPLSVLFEDEDIAVISKPAGLQTHPGAGREPRVTLAHALLARYPGWLPPGAPDRPGIVHRLDRDTSGLLVIARSSRAHRELSRQIQAREVTRRYVALVWGRPDGEEGRIELPLGRDPKDRRRIAVRPDGRPAATRWRVLRVFRDLTLLEIGLESGRTHQIRVHTAALGHPVFGDPVYGGARVWLDRVSPSRRVQLARWWRGLNRQALHAYHLAFRHPRDGSRLRFEAPVSPDIDQVLLDLCHEEASE